MSATLSRNGLSPPPSNPGPYRSLGLPESRSPTDSASKSSNVRNRTGCLTCKRRKKKCDEAKPVCKNCLRTSYVCEGYPPVRHFRGEEEGEQENAVDLQSVSHRTEPSSYIDPENLTAVAAAAVDEAKYLRQRVQQLELELGTLRKDRARTAPRLPSLRSLVQPGGLRRYSQPCPTCGQSTQLLENELNHPNESPVLTAHSPSSRSTGSENDTWSGSGNISTLSAPPLSIGSATAASFGGHAMLQRESGNMQPSGAAYPVVLPSLRNQSPHTACYECRSRNLQCNGAAPCDQCRRSSFPECSYQVIR